MAESNSAVVAWTAVAALVLSLSSVVYAVYRAARGPDVVGFPVEDVMLFEYQDGPAKGQLGATAKFDLANTSPDFPDILVSEIVRVKKDGAQRACLSERGEVELEQRDEPPPAAGAPNVALDALAQAKAPTRPDPAPSIAGAAETIALKGQLIGVFDRPSRAELRSGNLVSRRQLFDQRATASVVDPCHDPAGKRYTMDELLTDFPPGTSIELLYEAKLAESPGMTVSCTLEMTPPRFTFLNDERSINAACNASKAVQMADDGPLSGFVRFLNRIF
jgi:hypothetical protein